MAAQLLIRGFQLCPELFIQAFRAQTSAAFLGEHICKTNRDCHTASTKP